MRPQNSHWPTKYHNPKNQQWGINQIALYKSLHHQEEITTHTDIVQRPITHSRLVQTQLQHSQHKYNYAKLTHFFRCHADSWKRHVVKDKHNSSKKHPNITTISSSSYIPAANQSGKELTSWYTKTMKLTWTNNKETANQTLMHDGQLYNGKSL